jgi:hypothetical protein
MVLKRRIVILPLLLTYAAVDGSPKPDSIRHVYVLEDADKPLLCGFVDKTRWLDAPKREDPQFVAVATAENTRVTSIVVQRSTEDTATYDEYSLNDSGIVLEVKRTFDVVTARITSEQIWQVRNGKLVKISENWTEFKTHRPLVPDHRLDGRAERPLVMRLNEFPFAELITDQSPELWPTGRRCIPGSMNNLEYPPKRK